MKLILWSFVWFGASMLNAQVEYFVHVNTFTGKHVIIDSIPGIHWVMIGPSWSTVDKIKNVYYFKGADSVYNDYLIGIDGATGQVITKAALADSIDGFTNIGGLAHDDSTGIVYAYGWEYSQKFEYLLQIDKSTGSITPVSVIQGCKLVVLRENTYDQTLHNFYFKGVDSLGIDRLYVINSLSGAMLSAAVISNTLGVSSINYNSTTNKLYAFVKSNSGMSLSEIDPGSALPVNSVHNYPNITGLGWYPQYSSINEKTNELTFVLNKTLETLQLSSGITHFNVPFPVGLNPGENVIDIRYNSATGILFGLHWGKVSPTTLGLKDRNINRVKFSVFPNSAVDQATILIESTSPRVAVFLYDEGGKLLRTDMIFANNNYTIYRKDLPAGVYTIYCVTEEGEKAIQKIVFQ